MDAPFYLINHDNVFIIIDATDNTSYHFKIRDHKLYYINNDQKYLVITHIVRHVFPFYKLNVLTAYEDDPTEQPSSKYDIETQYLSDPELDTVFIEDYRDGLFLPQNPFAVYTDNTGTGVEKISIQARDQPVRCRLFYNLIVDYLKENDPCQDCGRSFAKDVYRNNISFELDDYQMVHQCIFCASKEDNIFEVHDFTIKDGNTTYEFCFEDHKLYLKCEDRKLLVYTREIEEHMPEPEGDGFHEMVDRFWLHTVVIVKDDIPFERPNLGYRSHFRGSKDERIIPENPNIKVFGIKKFEYFLRTLKRLMHAQPCTKCGTPHNLRSMTINPEEYFVHGWCNDCLRTVIRQKIDDLFEHGFEDHTMVIKHKETEQSYYFVVKNGKVYFNDKLVIALKYGGQTILRCFEEALLQQYLDQLGRHKSQEIKDAIVVDLTNTWKEKYGDWGSFLLKHGEVIDVPNTMVAIEIPSVCDLKDNTERMIELPCNHFFNLLLQKIILIVPCQQCGEKKPLKDRTSFMSLNHGCYYLDSRCKECWETIF